MDVCFSHLWRKSRASTFKKRKKKSKENLLTRTKSSVVSCTLYIHYSPWVWSHKQNKRDSVLYPSLVSPSKGQGHRHLRQGQLSSHTVPQTHTHTKTCKLTGTITFQPEALSDTVTTICPHHQGQTVNWPQCNANSLRASLRVETHHQLKHSCLSPLSHIIPLIHRALSFCLTL